MIAKNWRNTALVAVLGVSALLAPGVSHSDPDPVVNCVNAFGGDHPSTWCVSGYNAGVVTPTSSPSGYGVRGLLYVRGNATPLTRVTVSATDGVATVSKTVTSAKEDDAGSGKAAGDFNAELVVTDLGVHKARAGATPASTNPEDRGKSVLTVTAVALLPGDGTSPPLSTTVTKYAASYKDEFKPTLSNVKFPPQFWCHAPTTWRVGTLGIVTFTFNPLITCSTEEGATRTPFVGQAGTAGFFTPKGVAPIAGLADDQSGAPLGHASEIADVTIVIRQGTTVLRTISTITRVSGPVAKWDYNMRINDFEPNADTCEQDFETDLSGCYTITVTVTDAWGLTATTASPNITIYPF